MCACLGLKSEYSLGGMKLSDIRGSDGAWNLEVDMMLGYGALRVENYVVLTGWTMDQSVQELIGPRLWMWPVKNL